MRDTHTRRDGMQRLFQALGIMASLLMICSVSCPREGPAGPAAATVRISRADSSSVSGGAGSTLVAGVTGDEVSFAVIGAGITDVSWTFQDPGITTPGRDGNDLNATLGAGGVNYAASVSFTRNGTQESFTFTIGINVAGSPTTPSLARIEAGDFAGAIVWDYSDASAGVPHSIGTVGSQVSFRATLAAGSAPATAWEWDFTDNMSLTSAQAQSVGISVDSGGPGIVYPCVLRITNAVGTTEWNFAVTLDGTGSAEPTIAEIHADSLELFGPVVWRFTQPIDAGPKRIGAPGETITLSARLATGSAPVDTWEWQLPGNVTLLTPQGQGVDIRLDSGGSTYSVRLVTTNAAGSTEWDFSIQID